MKEVIAMGSGRSNAPEPTAASASDSGAATGSAAEDIRDQDVPFLKPGRERVDIQTITATEVGDTKFEVHCMIGVVPGQVLSIGREGSDLEHFIVKKLGSIETTEGLQYPHPVRSPVRIIRSSNGGPPGDANTARAVAAPSPRRRGAGGRT